LSLNELIPPFQLGLFLPFLFSDNLAILLSSFLVRFLFQGIELNRFGGRFISFFACHIARHPQEQNFAFFL